MDYLRRHGPFEPHRSPLEELRYTTMAELEELLAERWQPMLQAAVPVPR
ncbi:fructose 1,6-bisphosphate aldolase/phosphatase [Saccharopolyspora kobensis]|uniref:Fructose 1,6-bisphosphate aldolase/phosphatase n=1 Tax=Saccharopolyspora kobensis TaxID=146035 RepID=A0ABY1DRE4_9PSEU|nr:fructose 1,6-bisphosphatase [Saccharopolyspora kobensis]SFC64820.1 fructose 1,6-bisphosphate aldolase/phosphatase [Saccharopolyspora kobensis]